MKIDFIQERVLVNSRIIWLLLFFIVPLVLLTVVQDAVESYIQHSAFYVSESFLFSSFWWLFAPLFYVQYLIIQRKLVGSLLPALLCIMIPVVLHLILYPILVWLISGMFYAHTFAVTQTLGYTLSEHFYLLMLLYTLPFLFYRKYTDQTLLKPDESKQQALPTKTCLTSFLIAGANKHISVAANDVLYITASSPYAALHTGTQKHLYRDTLTSLMQQLDELQFVRIHKSAIVNIHHVSSYTSRLNGDYDITLHDGSLLRLSRNYAARFKEAFRTR